MREPTKYHCIVMKGKGGHFSHSCFALIIYEKDDEGKPFLYHFDLFYDNVWTVCRRKARMYGMNFINGRVSLGAVPNKFISPHCGITLQMIAEKLPDFYLKVGK